MSADDLAPVQRGDAFLCAARIRGPRWTRRKHRHEAIKVTFEGVRSLQIERELEVDGEGRKQGDQHRSPGLA